MFSKRVAMITALTAPLIALCAHGAFAFGGQEGKTGIDSKLVWQGDENAVNNSKQTVHCPSGLKVAIGACIIAPTGQYGGSGSIVNRVSYECNFTNTPTGPLPYTQPVAVAWCRP